MAAKKVTFFDPHPGFAGALIRLPEPIRRVAASLDGQSMTLKQALKKFRAVTDGELEVDRHYKYIALTLKPKTKNDLEHGFRLIRYR